MIEVYSTIDGQVWDEIVRSMERFDVYYLSGYAKTFEIHGDGQALLIYMHNDKARAIQVVMKRDIAEKAPFLGLLEKGTYFDIVTPYGYGGIISEGDGQEELLEEYERYCIENSIVCEFVRFHPLLKNEIAVQKFYEEIPLGNTVCIDTTDIDTVWKNMSSKNRNMIRKAQKNGIKIYLGRAPWMIDSFMKIYNATMNKDHAEAYYFFEKEFYEEILEGLKHEAMWFYAELEGKIISMAIFLFANSSMHYHLSGSVREYQNLAPSNLLLYEAAVWASKNGYKQLHLGGGLGSAQDNLYRFKKAFSRKEDKRFVIGKKIYNQKVYDMLVNIRKENDEGFNINNSYFPCYRGH